MRRRAILGGGAALAALPLLTACGGGFDDGTKAQLRLVNASGGYASLDLTVDDDDVQSAVGYGERADYADVDPDNTDTEIARPGSATALVNLTPSLAKKNHYTLLAYGGEGALRTLLLDDDTDEPASGKTLLRVVNAAPDAGSLDVYVTAAVDALSDAVALQAAAAYGTLGSHVSVNSATWRLRVTAAGSKTDVRLDVGNLVLDSQDVTTLVLTPGRGGVLVSALLLVDRGGIRRLDNTQARVRAAATVADGGAVTASIAGATLLNGVGAPAVNSSYVLVAAGAATASVSVNGNAVQTSGTLEAGGDYTLLVYGLPAAPQAALLTDDNRLPTYATQAKLRLVHGIAGVTATLALKIDFQPVADGVVPGTASAYALVTPSTDADLDVTAVGSAAPFVTLVDQTLAAGSTYTLFAGGRTGAPVGILKKDR